jgi:uracil-DNA glycosylase
MKKIETEAEFDLSVASPHETIAMLQWYVDHGVNDFVLETPQNRLLPPKLASQEPKQEPKLESSKLANDTKKTTDDTIKELSGLNDDPALENYLRHFQGLSICKTAMNMVFAAGDTQSPVTLINDWPRNEEDRTGLPLQGEQGQLIINMMKAIGLTLESDDPQSRFYATHLVKWRPPGGRTPNKDELALSSAILLKQLSFVKSPFLIGFGELVGQNLLGSNKPLNKLRGTFHSITLAGIERQAFITDHPQTLLAQPALKKSVWQELQEFQSKLKELV